MWKVAVGSLLVFVSLVLFYEAWAYWEQLTTLASFLLGVVAGGCLTAGLLVLLWRPSHPATRYTASLPSPSPWDRNRWR